MTSDNEAVKIVKNLKKNFEKFKKGKWTQGTLSQEAKLAYHTVAKIQSGATKDPRVSTVKKINNRGKYIGENCCNNKRR